MFGERETTGVSMFELQLLGRIDLRDSEGRSRASVLSQTKRFAFLAYLGASPGFVSRDVLMAVFWPDLDVDRARRALNQTVYQVRRSLGLDIIASRGELELGLDQEKIRCDVTELESALKGQEPGKAAELYAGDLLEGFHLPDCHPFDDWLSRRRDQLRDRAAYACLAAASSAVGEDSPVEVVRLARRATELAPYDEALHRGAIQLLVEVGDRGGATRVHDRLVERLRDDLEVDPSEETLHLGTVVRTNGDGAAVRGVEGNEPSLPSQVPEPVEARDDPAVKSRRVHGRWIVFAVATVGLAAVMVVSLGRVFADGTSEEVTVASPDPGRVLVMPFDDATGDPELEPLGRMAADWITQELARTGLVRVIPHITVAHVRAAASEQVLPEAISVARDHDAGLLVAGTVYGSGSELSFQASLIDVASGTLVRDLDPVAGTFADHAEVVEHLRDGVVGAVLSVVDERIAPYSHVASRPPDLEAYRLYAQGIDAFVQALGYEGQEFAAAQFMAAHEADSSFTAPLVWATYAYHNMGRFDERNGTLERLTALRDGLPPWDRAMADLLTADYAGRPMEAFDAARRAARLAPNSEWEFKRGVAGLEAGLYQEAAQALRNLYPFDRGWLRDWAGPTAGWEPYLMAMEEVGDYEALLEGARLMSRRYPEGWRRGVQYEVLALVHLGRAAEAHRVVETSLLSRPRDAPYVNVLLNLVGRLWTHGYVDWAQDLLENEIEAWFTLPEIERAPARLVTVSQLMALGRFEEAWALGESFDLLRDWNPRAPHRFAAYGVLAARAGHVDVATQVLEHFETLDPRSVRDHGQPPQYAGWVMLALGDIERAVNLLAEGRRRGTVPARDPYLLFLLEPVYDHPRFRAEVWEHPYLARREYRDRYGDPPKTAWSVEVIVER